MALAAVTASERLIAGADAHLVFLIGDQRMAVPLARVGTVARPPAVVDLPLSPAGVIGLVNLRGAVTAVLGLHESLGLSRPAMTDRSRLLVIEHGTPVALLVDHVLGVRDIAADRIEPASEAPGAAAGDFLAGIAGDRESGATLVLDVDRAVGRIFAAVAQPARRSAAAARQDPAAAPRPPLQRRVLVSFEADGEEYAVPIASVREIVAKPAGVSRVPHARDHVLGVVTLRDRLVPLVSARALLGLPAQLSGPATILVLSVGGVASVGLVVDRARQILRVDEEAVEPLPPLLAREIAGDIDAICRLDGGRRLVSIISPDHLLRSDAVIEALAASAQRQPTAPDGPAAGADGVERFIGFRLGTSEYGLPIGAVEEVIRVPEQLTAIPKAPAYVAGIVNRRGIAMPVIDQRRRFDLPAADAPARHIIVVAAGSIRVGFLVDAVTAVLKVPATAIGAAPGLSAEQARLIERIATLDGRLVLLVSPEQMVSADEIDTLADVGAGVADRSA